ncbi:MAG TPA: THUMP domain-containing protein [Thermoanaerobaculia bacterium]|nr:THUMP domain-containing protein [Thermoanaerobaculia bacterium]
MPDHLLILRHSGDFYTKARKTRLRFQLRLARNIEDALASHGIPYRLEKTWSRFYLETPEPQAIEVLTRVFGLQSVSVVEPRPWTTLEDIVAHGVDVFAGSVRGRTFAVRASRRGGVERIPFDSLEIERALGRALLDAGAGRVRLDDPEVTAWVEVEPGDPGRARFFHEKERSWGGLPIGVEGKAVALVSGGFDSAVASWLLLKRGVELDYVFCNLGGTVHRLGVLKVMKVVSDLWSYGSRPRLYEIDFQPVAAELRAKTRDQSWQILLKRQMVRAAEAIALKTGRLGMVTGEAIGQVSSQTLQNLAVISQAARILPVLRPLLGFNKEEILSLARRMGVYDLASAVGEYCDMVPRHPTTKAHPREIERDETGLDPDLLEGLVAARTVWRLRDLSPEALGPSELETDHIPEGATVLDLRPAQSYRAWHYPGSLCLDFPRALEAYPSFDRGRPYVLVCEVGLKSAALAEKMQQAGFRAWHFAGGIRDLMGLAEKEKQVDLSLLAPAVRD